VVVIRLVDHPDFLDLLVASSRVVLNGLVLLALIIVVIQQTGQRAYLEGLGVSAEGDIVAVGAEDGGADGLAVDEDGLLLHVEDVILCPRVDVGYQLLRVLLRVEELLLLLIVILGRHDLPQNLLVFSLLFYLVLIVVLVFELLAEAVGL
jgi:hypothetical protein